MCVCIAPSSCLIVKRVVHIVTIVLLQFHEQILCNAKRNAASHLYCPISPTALSVCHLPNRTIGISLRRLQMPRRHSVASFSLVPDGFVCKASSVVLMKASILRSAHTLYLCVLYGSENKQRLFPYTALSDWFV